MSKNIVVLFKIMILCLLSTVFSGCMHVDNSKPEIILANTKAVDVVPYIINFMAKKGYVVAKKNTIAGDYILKFEKPLGILHGVATSVLAGGAHNLMLGKSGFNFYKINADDRSVIVFSLTKLGNNLHVVAVMEMVMGSGLRFVKYSPSGSNMLHHILKDIACVFQE